MSGLGVAEVVWDAEKNLGTCVSIGCGAGGEGGGVRAGGCATGAADGAHRRDDVQAAIGVAASDVSRRSRERGGLSLLAQ